MFTSVLKKKNSVKIFPRKFEIPKKINNWKKIVDPAPPGIKQQGPTREPLWFSFFSFFLVVIWFCVGADHVSAARADHSPLTCPALARSFAHLSHHSDRTFQQVIPSSSLKNFFFYL